MHPPSPPRVGSKMWWLTSASAFGLHFDTPLERLLSCFPMHEPSARCLVKRRSMYSSPVLHSLTHHFQLLTPGHNLVNVRSFWQRHTTVLHSALRQQHHIPALRCLWLGHHQAQQQLQACSAYPPTPQGYSHPRAPRRVPATRDSLASIRRISLTHPVVSTPPALGFQLPITSFVTRTSKSAPIESLLRSAGHGKRTRI